MADSELKVVFVRLDAEMVELVKEIARRRRTSVNRLVAELIAREIIDDTLRQTT